jgi:hypothetical protein
MRRASSLNSGGSIGSDLRSERFSTRPIVPRTEIAGPLCSVKGFTSAEPAPLTLLRSGPWAQHPSSYQEETSPNSRYRHRRARRALKYRLEIICASV